MEFCSGGDLEDVVRKAGQLNVQYVRSFLFQMFFSFYTCRENLSLRHFDVKLLNFFVSTGASLLSSKQKKHFDEMTETQNSKINNNYCESYTEYSGNSVKMRVGFGDQIFCLPLDTDSLCVVKLADFGTSAVGRAGLGDPITAQQVCITL